MATKRRSNYVHMKVWTKTITADISGTIAACCIDLFCFASVETQGILLKKLNEAYEKSVIKKGGAA